MHYARLTPGHGFRPANSLLYYLQRLVVARRLRRLCVRMCRGWIGARHGRAAPSVRVDVRAAQAALERDGYAPLGHLLSLGQCAEVRAFLADKRMVDRHDTATRFTIAAVPARTRLGDFTLPDIVACPHILALCNSPLLIELATAYIGCKPTISQLGMRWSFPCAEGASKLQRFHRDAEDWRYFKVLVYLTDVGPADGPHVFVRGSHLERASVRLQPFDDAGVRARYGQASLMAALGVAGSALAVDTAGIHKGQSPTAGPRLMVQIQYSLCPSYAYEYEPQPYNGKLALDPYINRLLLRVPGAR